MPSSPSPTRRRLSVTALLTEPRRALRVRERADAHWFAVGAVCIGAFMGQLDASIVTLAFPALRKDFHASLAAVEWAALAYLVTLVALVPAVGWLADRAGRKLLYTYGFAVFALASVGCGLAPDLWVLVLLRIVQAVGAAMLQANSMAIITLVMPEGRLGRGIGLQGTAQALGLALGPTVGGLLVGLGGWRLVFLVNGPIGVLGVVAGWLLIPRTRDFAARTRFDAGGVALLASASTALLLALSEAARRGVTPAVLGLLAAALLASALLVRQERRTPSPLIDPALLRAPPFALGIGTGLLSYFVAFGTLFVTPFFLEVAAGLTPAEAGLLLTLLPLALAVTAPLGGRIADRRGAATPTVAGLAATAGGLLLAVVLRSHLVGVGAGLAVAGLGLGLFTPANNAAVMSAAPARQAGSAGGLLNATRGIGTSLGVAAGALLFARAGAESKAAAGQGFARALLVFVGVAAVAAAVSSRRER